MELKNKKNIKNELLRKRREKEEVRSEEYMEKEGTEDGLGSSAILGIMAESTVGLSQELPENGLGEKK
ncbi:hypothetical protein M8J77_016224 [Diaphorina citri]|nr:hypothetical protein M8J77_016224 [Diaphorina citri]